MVTRKTCPKLFLISVFDPRASQGFLSLVIYHFKINVSQDLKNWALESADISALRGNRICQAFFPSPVKLLTLSF